LPKKGVRNNKLQFFFIISYALSPMESDAHGPWQPILCKLFEEDNLDVERALAFMKIYNINKNQIRDALFQGILPDTPPDQCAEVASNIAYFSQTMGLAIKNQKLKKIQARTFRKQWTLLCDLLIPRNDQMFAFLRKTIGLSSINSETRFVLSKESVMKCFDPNRRVDRKVFSECVDMIFEGHGSKDKDLAFVHGYNHKCVICDESYYQISLDWSKIRYSDGIIFEAKDKNRLDICLYCLLRFETEGHVLEEHNARKDFTENMKDFMDLVTSGKFDTENGVVPSEDSPKAKRKRHE